MKRVLFIMALLSIVLTAGAQEKKDSLRDISMDRTFSVGGKALVCVRSASMGNKDLRALTWTLENDRVGDSNFVKFECKDAKTGEIVAYKNWNEGVHCVMRINEAKNEKSYFVLDNEFYHLRIVDIGKEVYMIMFYSDLINSPSKLKE